MVEIMQHLGQHDEDRGSDNWPEFCASAAKKDSEQGEDRAEELKIVRADVILLMGEQGAAEPGKCCADYKDNDLEAINVNAEG